MKTEKKNPLAGDKAAQVILESISDGVFTVDKNWRITFFNRAAEKITGISKNEAIGRFCSEVFRSGMCESFCPLRNTMKTGTPRINQAGYIINANGKRIPITVSTALLKDEKDKIIGGAETFRDLSEIEALRQELKGKHQLGDIVSRSPAMKKVLELAEAVAESSSTVLIKGETGTGKELLARGLHYLSLKKDGPFVPLNCGALPDSLLESELFGYKKGAFTGAEKDKPGRFAAADRGTLFLDEIGEITPALQVRLLRVLQERQYEPLGSIKSEKTGARIITATNRDLENMVQKGLFRQDLFYRINVIILELPPLRQRLEDIPLLVDHFLENFNLLQTRKIIGLTGEALTFLMSHNWPGNIRELENVIERAFILCRGSWIGPEHLPKELTGCSSEKLTTGDIKSIRGIAEKQWIMESLKRNQNNRAATARELGIHKTTLYRKMKALGIE